MMSLQESNSSRNKRGENSGGNNRPPKKTTPLEMMVIYKGRPEDNTATMADFKVDGAVMRFFRRVRALPQAEIAKRMNMTTGSLNGIERGKFVFQQKYAERFIEVLKDYANMTEEMIEGYLFFYDDIKNVDEKETAKEIHDILSN